MRRIRKATKKVVPCNVLLPQVLPEEHWEMFDVVLSILCLEAAAKDKDTYETALGHVVDLVKPGGIIVLGGMCGNPGYFVGQTWFPDLRISEETIRGAFKALKLEVIRWEVRPLDRQKWPGIPEMAFDSWYVVAVRKTF